MPTKSLSTGDGGRALRPSPRPLLQPWHLSPSGPLACPLGLPTVRPLSYPLGLYLLGSIPPPPASLPGSRLAPLAPAAHQPASPVSIALPTPSKKTK